MLPSETDKVAIEAASGLMSLDPTKKSTPLLHSQSISSKTPTSHQPLSNSSSLLSPRLPLPVLVAVASSASEVKPTENGSAAGGDDRQGMMDRDHKKRSRNWTRQEAVKLIKLRTEYDVRLSRSSRKMEVWEEIARKMQSECIFRDGQQCRDKWEKLSAGYKEVREGLKARKENPFFDDLHFLLSEKTAKKERSWDGSRRAKEKAMGWGGEAAPDLLAKEFRTDSFYRKGASAEDARGSMRKKSKSWKHTADLAALESFLENVLTKQQIFFTDLVASMERRQQWREQAREEMEKRWRSEDRVQLSFFSNAMLLLIQQLGVEPPQDPGSTPSAPHPKSPQTSQFPKKRSKNWKRSEVVQLIKAREEMENKFASSRRKSGLWEEVSEVLKTRGIRRDGKQCREKWDKLMSVYKDVGDERRERGNGPGFAELAAIVGSKPAE